MAVPDSLYRFIFFRPAEIGFLCAVNDFYFYRLHFSLFAENFQEALEDLHHIEEITGKSKFFLTVCLCLYILTRFSNCRFPVGYIEDTYRSRDGGARDWGGGGGGAKQGKTNITE